MMTGSLVLASPAWVTHTRNLIIIVLVAGAFMVAANFGYEGTDDYYYYNAAMCWLKNGPCVGTEHWSLRLPPIFLTALSFRVWGVNEFALVLPQAIIFFLLLSVNYIGANKFFDEGVALWTTLIIAAVPFFALVSTHLNVDLIETAFVVVSFWLLYAAGTWTDRRSQLLAAAGMAASVAWLTRETTAAFLTFIALLFLSDRRYGWRAAIPFGLGAAPLVLIETVFYWIRTGSPFYRLQVDLGHTQIHSAHLAGGVAEKGIPLLNADLAQRWLPTGIFDIHWLVNPYVNLLIHPLTALLIPFALIAWVAILRWRDRPDARKIAFLLLAMGVVWVLFVNYVLTLRPQPRYYGPLIYAAAFVFGFWLSDLMRRRRVLAVAMAGVFLATAWVILDAGWRQREIFVSKQFAGYLVRSGEQVHAPATIIRRSQFYLESNGVTSSAITGAVADATFAFCPDITQGSCVGSKDEWVEVWRVTPEPLLIIRIATELGMISLLPNQLVEALQARRHPVGVYQRLPERPLSRE